MDFDWVPMNEREGWGTFQLKRTRRDTSSGTSSPFPSQDIQPTPVRGVISLPIHERVRLILKGQAPLVLTFPGFQERKHGVVSDPEVLDNSRCISHWPSLSFFQIIQTTVVTASWTMSS